MSSDDPTKDVRPVRLKRSTTAAGTEREAPTPRRVPSMTPTDDAAAQSATPSPLAASPKNAGSAVAASGASEEVDAAMLDADSLDKSGGGGSFLFLTAVPSWLTSMIIHVIVLLSLAMWSLPDLVNPERKNELVIGNTEEEVDQLDDFLPEEFEPVDIESLSTSEPMSSPEMEAIIDEPNIGFAQDPTAAAMKIDIDPLGLDSAPRTSLLQTSGALSGSALAGRGQQSRARMVREGGGSKGSEEAVARALRWLAEHQLPDGGWHLNHRLGPCQGRCSNPGTRAPARFGATGLALLPFLGAGHTHLEGEYKEVVGRGLQFLLRNMTVIGKRGRLFDEGNYYSHGLCAITLCEAFAMSRDKSLMTPAQLTINETVFAQDPFGGGWRYKPQEPGDTSAVGWQVMALKSANMAYLQVPAITIQKASLFLDAVQSDDGARYGYQDPGNRGSTTSVGLLCRMYMGWKRDNPALKRGVAFLSKTGPSKVDIYYNYYATQVMRHFGGYEWERWNEVMREFLIETQDTAGHEQGSWYFDTGHHHVEAGGRIYCTSLATMILEVYYRHMPLYQEEVTDDEFPL